jgi:hypothetical protein
MFLSSPMTLPIASLGILESALEVELFGCSIVIFELIEKHTSHMDIGVTTSRGDIWHNVLNQEWLVELVCVGAISEVKSYVI